MKRIMQREAGEVPLWGDAMDGDDDGPSSVSSPLWKAASNKRGNLPGAMGSKLGLLMADIKEKEREDEGTQARVKILTKRPLVPTDTEIAFNPRSRPSKLRVVEKLPL